MLFTGASALSLDTKGRLSMPTRHRASLRASDAAEDAPTQLTITRHPDGCLMIFPAAQWARFSAQLTKLPISRQWMKRLFIGHAQTVEMDATGRVLIPPELREAAEITQEALLLGMVDYLEVWEPAKHAAKETLDLARGGSEAFKDFAF
jgi:MraZ protein